ncbi:uncharacterized protein LOC132204967 isoform X1 [Neocloeon triangulifer]|uniref:uncharacterized protein LOC132204587 isoform X1 n=1 Tax=Neocloeon triangulifer TaxID=2078957 RepID=UPI00286EE356|nr:uncharacterized protein LOC132204587 isoform X1 [Neocloeon triangulifer]XP_059489750.1 uncharacterized protein LOC132204967 isoform X1 [Neocloeon triangulifer]
MTMAAVKSPVKNVFPTEFHTVCVEYSENSTVLRANLSSVDEIDEWVKEFSKISRSCWIVEYCYEEMERYHTHKRFHCHLSKLNKKVDSKRTTNCKVTLDIKIKLITRDTKKKDKYLRPDKHGIVRQAVIKFEGVHNHHILSADTLRLNRVDPSTAALFDKYFDDGSTAAQARKRHEDLLISNDDFVNLADANINPTKRTVSYLFDKWSNKQFGVKSLTPIEKTQEKIASGDYISRDVLVKTSMEDGEWCILIVTPLMKRVQELPHSGETLFLDSTSHVDVTHCTFTSMCSATKAGAMPLCILLQSHQTQTCYEMAFNLYKRECPKGFGGSEAPSVVMTDDSSAERKAVESVWPTARRLLCVFHVLSAEWKWLLSNCNKNDRQKLMNLYYKAVYANTLEEFESASESILAQNEAHPKYVKRFQKFAKRVEEWAIYARVGAMNRGNDTNNFAETSIKIAKEAVMQRMKAYNPVALIEFVIGPMDDYYKRRLLDHAHNRHSAHSLVFDKMLKRASSIDPNKIIKIDENLYSVPSSISAETFYEVRTDSGFCSCKSGERGAFCKHMALLVKYKKAAIPSAPPLLSSDRKLLAKVALGDKTLPTSFYLGRTEVASPTSSPQKGNQCNSHDEASGDNEDEFFYNNEMEVATETDENVFDEADRAEKRKQLENDFSDFLDLALVNISPELVEKMGKALRKPKTTPAAQAALVAFYRAVNSVLSKKGRTGVNPSGRARRRVGVSKGAAQIASGRPPKSQSDNNGPKKRKRDLSQAVKDNCANAKSH